MDKQSNILYLRVLLPQQVKFTNPKQELKWSLRRGGEKNTSIEMVSQILELRIKNTCTMMIYRWTKVNFEIPQYTYHQLHSDTFLYLRVREQVFYKWGKLEPFYQTLSVLPPKESKWKYTPIKALLAILQKCSTQPRAGVNGTANQSLRALIQHKTFGQPS